jgi:N-methylhydantoinase A
MIRVGVDVGGTFTDLILANSETGQIWVHKVPSTVEDQSIGVIKGIAALCQQADVALGAVDYVLHGTTVATNITIERNGATVGMITTRNYRDILHIARHKKVENFSLQQELPWQTHPLVKRRFRLAVTEKLAAPDGRVRVPLNEDEVRIAARRLKDAQVDAVIVCFLFSFLNDQHERRARELVREVWPEVPVYTSSEVVPQIREYERFSTTAMNAYVAPRVARYIHNLRQALDEAGVKGELHIMQSSGGMATAEMALAKPVTLLKSGPAGGVLAGAWWGEMDGVRNLISVDIGGTSADISVIPGGQPRTINSRDAQVNGYPVLAPMIDVETIGAGGGSIAYIDAGGAFRVGPKSAGAMPGPACYGQGGENPCVTDANVVLGRLDPEQFLGGDLKLNPELAFHAVEERIARPLGISVEQAALGILRIINNNMALSIRANSVRKGIDPRDYAIFAAGGAGPLHSVDLAETVESSLVVVPNYPGIAAATGLLVGDLKYDYIRSRLVRLDKLTPAVLEAVNGDLMELTDQARQQLLDDGVASADIVVERIAECRYVGQGFELRAPIPDGPVTAESAAQIVAAFHQAHQVEYDHHFPDNAVELITLRVVAIGRTPTLKLPRLEQGGRRNPQEAVMYVRDTVFEVNGDLQRIPTPRYQRSKLLAGDLIQGPAVIVQRDSTSVLPPHWQATVSAYGSLFLAPKIMKGGAARMVEELFAKAGG